ncbi:MAG: vanadium-dependent haloperoxidase [Gammaproteobacteria bacterium]|nr:vanadium-dependent haloperoxidase [Gammaproteobacteria bacterium]
MVVLLLAGWNLAIAQSTLEAQADFNVSSGSLCFPVLLQDDGALYDVCLQLEAEGPGFRFSLQSAAVRGETLPGIATYSQLSGLTLPIVHFTNGSLFAQVTFNASLDSSSGDVVFIVTGGEEIGLQADHSIARIWNDVLLDGIRNDFARPTVHSRNLFHASALMYDAWAVFDDTAETYLLGKTLNGFTCDYAGMPLLDDVAAARKEAISFGAYRLLNHRFAKAPGAEEISVRFDQTLLALGFDKGFVSTDYSAGNAAALGNYLAQCLIDYGLQDGANESNDYSPLEYVSVNEPMIPSDKGNPTLTNPDRWQPLSFEEFRDQSGNLFFGNTPEFVGPEWGMVYPFSLKGEDLTIYQRDGADWWVYHDPDSPPYIDTQILGLPIGEFYKWGFQLVSQWSSHLDPDDGVLWDISPMSIGNVQELPTTLSDYKNYYKKQGGDSSLGREINPYTGDPYEPQLVPRGDYARVLAEFWADGPESETPPGHWFTILNSVSDSPLLEKRFKGEGEVLDDLEWDIKAYFALGGAMHDSAVTAWGIKGWYDYIRPISAIRYMADQGQSSNSNDPDYDLEGIQLIPGFIEKVQITDPLAGDHDENVGKIKLYAWRGPDFVKNPAIKYAAVGWILAEEWWPYQRPTFVTPPFAGYVSGHSTFSRAAAHVMTMLTGDEYFPGGLGEFHAPKNEFLVFEEGPSVDVVLQWATYQDASDQTSLSRIWGGIHPPADDIPGRLIGDTIGPEAFSFAEQYFSGTVSP